jgi:hypothetical protein
MKYGLTGMILLLGLAGCALRSGPDTKTNTLEGCVRACGSPTYQPDPNFDRCMKACRSIQR